MYYRERGSGGREYREWKVEREVESEKESEQYFVVDQPSQ